MVIADHPPIDVHALVPPKGVRADEIHWALSGPLSEDGEVHQVALDSFPFQVGRRADLPYMLARPTISSVHAEFVYENGQVFVCDLESTNGTYVNGERVIGRAAVTDGDLIQFADVPFRIGRGRPQRDSRTMCEDVCDQALALVQFERLMAENAVVPYYQPIVDIQTHEYVAYEVLARSYTVGLETPLEMFRAASQLRLEVELSRMMQFEGVRRSSGFARTPHLFINTHPAELADPKFFNSLEDLRRLTPTQQLTLEIHEAAVTEPAAMRLLRDHLDALEIRLAFDDFGAGQARIAELAEIRPHYLKFDRQIIQNIDSFDSRRRRVVRQLVEVALGLDVIPLAEGIESKAENDACAELGFQLAQGFLYGRPAPVGSHADAGF